MSYTEEQKYSIEKVVQKPQCPENQIVIKNKIIL